MAITNKLIEILCCPITKTPVQLLDNDKLNWLNQHILQRNARYVDGSLIEKQLEQALITIDGKTVYSVEQDIPIMLAERGVSMDQFTQSL
jgi:uncharacterized protein YbaR (Trm112 family)